MLSRKVCTICGSYNWLVEETAFLKRKVDSLRKRWKEFIWDMHLSHNGWQSKQLYRKEEENSARTICGISEYGCPKLPKINESLLS